MRLVLIVLALLFAVGCASSGKESYRPATDRPDLKKAPERTDPRAQAEQKTADPIIKVMVEKSWCPAMISPANQCRWVDGDEHFIMVCPCTKGLNGE
jgi:PBP1b-binding outer membrane lipoprotein LpoB